MLERVNTIHPTAFVHEAATVENASVGARTKVWQYATIIRNAWVGQDCKIGSCSIIDGAILGDECAVGHGAQLHPGTQIGQKVFIGPGAIFCNDCWPRIEKDGFDLERLLDGSFCTIAVAEKASIGAGAIILPGVKIGRGAMIAAGVTVRKSVPAFHLFKPDGSIVPLAPRNALRLRAA